MHSVIFSKHFVWSVKYSSEGFRYFFLVEIENFAGKNDDAEAISNQKSAQIYPNMVHRHEIIVFFARKWFPELRKMPLHARVKLVDTVLNTSLNQLI